MEKLQQLHRARCMKDKNVTDCSSEHTIGAYIPMPPILEEPEFITVLW